ncbi:RidA family protein [Acetomicrobium sp.]|uniref:RidA family protein n=1 Tax=Acetomicrobium sp. TaxID=1872099 RepID=UPI002FC62087
MGLELPQPPIPLGSYVSIQVAGNLIFTSGQTAAINGERRFLGKVGQEISLEEGKLSARDACLNCLASIKKELGSLDAVEKIIKVVGYVNSAPGFNQQPQVINGASDLLVELWGECGRHARSAVGVAELPANSSVELDIIAEIKR